MKRNWRALITAVGLAATLASVTSLESGCVVRTRARVTAGPVVEVEEAPPPPRRERVVVRPGYVWIRGRWEFRGGHWVWRAGFWRAARAGYVWDPGHWQRRGRRYVWVEGRWVVRGRVHIERR
ncbi:MAG TPA: YXWGXW repeat-containing protein [Kofleriaceae bacterium]|nr:YXWGXW repeat-containing protein [Kofleriaceae bacterium]